MAESFMYGLNASSIPYDGINKYLRITDIDDKSHKLIIDNLTSPNVKIEDSQEYLLKTGDLLFARTGASVGKTYLYNDLDGTIFFAGFLIRMRVRESYNRQFIFQSTLTEKYNNFVKITSQRSGQPGINAKEYSEFNLEVPSKITEQNRLGSLTEKLDALIELYQEKLTLYESLKEYMLQVIFPSINENIPIVRFTGFHDNWEQLRFDDLFEGLKNNTLSRDKLNYSRGSIQNIHYGDILTKFNEILNISNNNIPYINPQYSKNSIGNLLVDGDIIFADTAEDDMVGKCIEIQKMDKYKVVSGLHTMAVRPNKIISRYYLGYYLNSKYYQIQLVPLMQGVKVLSISKKNISGTHIDYPNNNLEEEKIGTMLQSIDKICILQKNTLSKLKQLKKYYLKKLFI